MSLLRSFEWREKGKTCSKTNEQPALRKLFSVQKTRFIIWAQPVLNNHYSLKKSQNCSSSFLHVFSNVSCGLDKLGSNASRFLVLQFCCVPLDDIYDYNTSTLLFPVRTGGWSSNPYTLHFSSWACGLLSFKMFSVQVLHSFCLMAAWFNHIFSRLYWVFI